MIDASTPATILIILITALVSMRGFNHPEFRARFIFDVQLIQRQREYIRLITSGFLHASWIHLIFNMLSLFFFGRYIEIVLGSPLYILLYLIPARRRTVVTLSELEYGVQRPWGVWRG